MQQQAKQEQLLNQVGHSLNSSLDPNYILEEIVRLTGECFGVDRALIYATKAEEIHIKNEWLGSDDITSMRDYTAPLSEWAVESGPSLTDSQPIFMFHAPDYAARPPTPARLDALQHKKVLSVLGVPIFIRDQFLVGLNFTPPESTAALLSTK